MQTFKLPVFYNYSAYKPDLGIIVKGFFPPKLFLSVLTMLEILHQYLRYL